MINYKISIVLILMTFLQVTIVNSKVYKIPKNQITEVLIVNKKLDKIAENDTDYFFYEENSSPLAKSHSIESYISVTEFLSSMSLSETIKNESSVSYSDFLLYSEKLQKICPQIIKKRSIGTTFENRDILSISLTDKKTNSSLKKNILIVGGTHAREWISIKTSLNLLGYFCQEYSHNQKIQSYLQNFNLVFVPMLNPDGVEYTINHNRFWRKNRQVIENSECIGIDNNRNFDYHWGESGVSFDPCHATFPGASPISTAENLAIDTLAKNISFDFVLNYHSYSQLIGYPYGYTTKQTPDSEIFDNLALKMVNSIFDIHSEVYNYGQTSRSVYSFSGGLCDYFYGKDGTACFGVELRSKSSFIIDDEESKKTFEENLPAFFDILDWRLETKLYIPQIIQSSRQEVSLSYKPGHYLRKNGSYWLVAMNLKTNVLYSYSTSTQVFSLGLKSGLNSTFSHFSDVKVKLSSLDPGRYRIFFGVNLGREDVLSDKTLKYSFVDMDI